MMIRKLLLPAIAAVLLAGCVTDGYSYRQDRGDYYYGQPGTDYRHYGSPYGYGYGSGYYSNSYYRRAYPGYYRNPYGYYGYPHGYYRPPVVIRPRPDNDNDHQDRNDDDRKAPWRNYERLQRERVERSPVVQPSPVVQRRPMAVPARPATPVRARDTSGRSRMEKVMSRARAGAVRNGEDER